jgi:hypothetical protein
MVCTGGSRKGGLGVMHVQQLNYWSIPINNQNDSNRRTAHVVRSMATEADGAPARSESESAAGLLGMFAGLVGSQGGSGTPSASDGHEPLRNGDVKHSNSTRPSGAESYWKTFLTQLKKQAAAEIRVLLQSRLRQFYTQDLASLPDTGPTSAPSQLQKLQGDLLLRMRKVDVWAEQSENEWAETTEALERFVCSQLHDMLLSSPADLEADEAFSVQCDTLASFVTPAQIGLSAGAVEPAVFADAWASAQDFLHRLTLYKDPWRKLLCIDRCCRQIYRILHASVARSKASKVDVEGGEATGGEATADDLVPAVIWCLLRCNPPRLHSHLQFVRRHRPDSRLRGSLAYHLTVMESAMHFVMTASSKHFEGMSDADFAARMEEGRAKAESRKRLAEQLRDIGSGAMESSEPGEDVSSRRGPPPTGIGVLTPPTSVEDLPFFPELKHKSLEGLDEWKQARYRFMERDPSSLTLAEVPQLLEEYRNLARTCVEIAAALGLPPPDVQALRPTAAAESALPLDSAAAE